MGCHSDVVRRAVIFVRSVFTADRSINQFGRCGFTDAAGDGDRSCMDLLSHHIIKQTKCLNDIVDDDTWIVFYPESSYKKFRTFFIARSASSIQTFSGVTYDGSDVSSLMTETVPLYESAAKTISE